jgi:hypothetical protein
MRVPPVVQSGSTPFVILDCDYDLSETEGTQVGVQASKNLRSWGLRPFLNNIVCPQG